MLLLILLDFASRFIRTVMKKMIAVINMQTNSTNTSYVIFQYDIKFIPLALWRLIYAIVELKAKDIILALELFSRGCECVFRIFVFQTKVGQSLSLFEKPSLLSNSTFTKHASPQLASCNQV